MTPDEIRTLTANLMARDRETFMTAQPDYGGEYPGLAEIIAEVFAAGFAFGAAAGLEISKEVYRDAALQTQRRKQS